MRDGDVLPLHDDPRNEQADEPLAPGETERLQAVADGRREGRDVGARFFHACTLGMLSLQVLDSSACGLQRGLQPLAPSLEFGHPLVLSLGLRFSARIPYAQMQQALPLTTWAERQAVRPRKGERRASITPFDTPNVRLCLAAPVAYTTLFGLGGRYTDPAQVGLAPARRQQRSERVPAR